MDKKYGMKDIKKGIVEDEIHDLNVHTLCQNGYKE